MLSRYMGSVGGPSISTSRDVRRAKLKTRKTSPRLRTAIEPLELRTLLSVSIINGAGAGYRGNGSGGPPDVTGAAGPSSYLEITNDTVTLFSPKGPNRTILTQHSISDFFYNSSIGNQTRIDAPGNIVSNIAASPTGATEAGNTVTITTTAAHSFQTGQTVVIAGVGVAGYNGSFTITGRTNTTFTYTNPAAGLAASGGGTATVSDPGSCGVCDSTGFFDPLMGANGRFVIGDIDIDGTTNTSQFIFAVSTSSNPTTFTTADWNFYHITTTRGTGDTTWTDYPGNPGYNADAVVVTFNKARGGGLTGDAEVLSINATDLANGVAQGSLNFFINDIAGTNSYRPTAMQDAAPGGPMWLVRNPNNGTNVDVVRMSNVLSNAATFTTTSLALPAAFNYSASGISNPLIEHGGDEEDEPEEEGEGEILTYNDPDNPGNSPASDVDDRILNASLINNTLVAAQKVAVGSASVVSATVLVQNGTPVGGSGYTVGDTLTFTGGTFSTAAQVTVATLGAGGSVATVTVATPGSYTSFAGFSGNVSGGTGSGARFSVVLRGELDVQWYAFNVGGGAPVFQQVGGVNNLGRIGFGNNTYCVQPAVAINSAGEIGLGFMESDTVGGAANAATGGFISTYVTARQATDAAGSMQPVVLASAGTGSATITGRIGDFSGMNVDPVNGTFWHVNEFGGGGGPTVIANFTPEAKPTVTAPSDQVAVEGASKLFNLGSFTDPDGSPWNVDIDWGDGTAHTTFASAVTGSLGTQSHTFAEESAADHPGSNPYVVTVTVTDFTNLIGSATFDITVSDPAVLPTGGFTVNAVEGVNSGTQTVATFTDPGGAEPLIDYSADIDWGDGTSSSTGSISFSTGVFTVQGDHTFASGLGLPDDFGNSFCGATPPSYSKTITITTHHETAVDAITASTAHIELPPASAHLAGGSLIVIGTVGNDQFILTPVGNTGAVAVSLNNVSLGSFTLGVGGRVIVAGLDGNDDIQVAGGVRANTVLYGGPGNDRIKGGGGRNILCGCEGDDQLIAGKLDDLVIGGDGRDNLNSVAGSDILVAGNVIDPITLAEDEKFSHLVNILNGGIFTAADDGDVDILQGASATDRFYYHFSGAGPFDIAHGKTENRFNT